MSKSHPQKMTDIARTRQKFNTEDAHFKIKRRTFVADGKEQTVTTLEGYPIVWNTPSSDRGGYVVKLAKSSAQFTNPVMALFHHQFDKPLGTTQNGTLRVLPADDQGVPVEIDLNMDTSIGRDVAAWVERGDIKGMSFSMANGFENYTEAKEGDTNVLTCSKFTVDEVTVTAIPAFSQTSIGMKPEDDEDDDYNRSSPTRIAAASRHAANRLHLCRLPR